jgi:hypothetical protein
MVVVNQDFNLLNQLGIVFIFLSDAEEEVLLL